MKLAERQGKSPAARCVQISFRLLRRLRSRNKGTITWVGFASVPLLALLPAGALVYGVVGVLAASAPAHPSGATDSLGRELFETSCAACHGSDGSGVEGRGPSLHDEGEAAVDFVLRTGRMPMADPATQARRGPVRFTEEQIVALVSYAGAFGDGAAIPDVDATSSDIVAGGELFRLECAACHTASGAGAAIGGGREAPSLMESTPTEIGEAIIIGPGAMPSFESFDDAAIDNVAGYIAELQASDATSIDSFGGVGPVAEGLAAWLLGLLPLIAITRWIGRPHEGRDAPLDDARDGGDSPVPSEVSA